MSSPENPFHPPSQKFIDEQQAKYFDFSDIILTETEPITHRTPHHTNLPLHWVHWVHWGHLHQENVELLKH
jgi:hypothetical protein